MLFFEYSNLPLWLNLMLGQFIGATLFYRFDRWIFILNNYITLHSVYINVENDIPYYTKITYKVKARTKEEAIDIITNQEYNKYYVVECISEDIDSSMFLNIEESE